MGNFHYGVWVDNVGMGVPTQSAEDVSPTRPNTDTEHHSKLDRGVLQAHYDTHEWSLVDKRGMV